MRVPPTPYRLWLLTVFGGLLILFLWLMTKLGAGLWPQWTAPLLRVPPLALALLPLVFGVLALQTRRWPLVLVNLAVLGFSLWAGGAAWPWSDALTTILHPRT